MPTVGFEADIEPISVEEGSSLIDALLQRDVNCKMLCGRRGMCATCHVYVEESPDALSPQTDREKMSLVLLTGAKANSRLACQAKVVGDGLKLRMPEGLYVESLSDLESYVGKRTTVPILHPINGDVLVEANKIIVRSMIMKLNDTDFDIDESAVLGREPNSAQAR